MASGDVNVNDKIEKISLDDKPAKDQNNGKIKLVSSDGKPFLVAEGIVKQNVTCTDLMGYCNSAEGIPLPNVNAKTLKKVITFCERFVNDPSYNPDTDHNNLRHDPRVSSFMKNISSQDLMDLLLAANYLNNSRLIDAGLLYIHHNHDGMTVEEIRHALHLENDFTREEEAVFKKSNEPSRIRLPSELIDNDDYAFDPPSP
jgi:S-phase kinase-associated protein 1